MSKEQSRDTGMAMTLILLLLSIFLEKDGLVVFAVLALLVAMTAPSLFSPVAVVWLGFSHILGNIVSKILLSLVFVLLVTPMGLLRRLLGKDVMQLKKFKLDTKSVMVERNHLYTAKDIEKPY